MRAGGRTANDSELLSGKLKQVEFWDVNHHGSTRQGDAMSFGLYSIGFAILIGGLIYAAHLVHMPAHWIVVGAIVLLGVGILSGVKATRQKDPAE
jgi:hypothetical protein